MWRDWQKRTNSSLPLLHFRRKNMTVQELINELMKIEDKSMIVEVIQMMIGEYFTQESERVEIDAKEHTVYIW
ncbi:hypothetical protein BTA35_0217550 [Oceanospirillum linum]|uniref:Uncharacterized protein n=2 Tax=Oceanospirillum linum TaxID=966 RepID=A0A1T1GBH9_OCELI|nr:hypothetical protein BTA35_0217550 [Oceanospirillum linum]